MKPRTTDIPEELQVYAYSPPQDAWKDKSNYPDPKTAVNEEWAWEFLRRNPQYRKDSLLFFTWLLLIGQDEEPPTLPDMAIRLGSVFGNVTELDLEVARYNFFQCPQGVYGINFPIDVHANYDSDTFQHFFSYSHRSYPVLLEQSNNYTEMLAIRQSVFGDAVDMRTISIHFSLSHPVGEQIKAAKKILENEQERYKESLRIPSIGGAVESKPVDLFKEEYGRPVRSLPDEWLRYLRILDADSLGVSTEEIVKTIHMRGRTKETPELRHDWDSKDSINNEPRSVVAEQRRKASSLRDYEYRFLPRNQSYTGNRKRK